MATGIINSNIGSVDISAVGASITGAISNLYADRPYVTETCWYNDEITVPAGGTKDIFVKCSKPGYTLVGVIGWFLGSAGNYCTTVFCEKINPDSCIARLINFGTSDRSGIDFRVEALFVRN